MLGVEVVSGDGVGDDENFPHDRGEGDLSGSFVVVGDAIVEVAHRRGMADSGAGGVEQGAAHERSSMTGFGLPDSFSAFVGVGGEADEGGYLFSTQMAEFRQVGDERCGDDRADAAHGAQDLRQATELPIAGDVTLDRLFNGVETLSERSDDEGQALANERVVCQIGAAAFGLPGVDKLSAPGGQRPQALVSAKRRRQIGAALLRQRDSGQRFLYRSPRFL
jgi:hypothetical protein